MISLASEMTDRKGKHARGWLFFDAECAFCTRIARFLAGPMHRRGLAVAALQDPRVSVLLGLSRQELLRAVRFVAADGSHSAGADALFAVAQELWWARPLAWAAKIPGISPAMRAAYGWGSARWNCNADRCLADHCVADHSLAD
jgi:predicted DCC family thiol-disulfide oxidoreductase YuxK